MRYSLGSPTIIPLLLLTQYYNPVIPIFYLNPLRYCNNHNPLYILLVLVVLQIAELYGKTVILFFYFFFKYTNRLTKRSPPSSVRANQTWPDTTVFIFFLLKQRPINRLNLYRIHIYMNILLCVYLLPMFLYSTYAFLIVFCII